MESTARFFFKATANLKLPQDILGKAIRKRSLAVRDLQSIVFEPGASAWRPDVGEGSEAFAVWMLLFPRVPGLIRGRRNPDNDLGVRPRRGESPSSSESLTFSPAEIVSCYRSAPRLQNWPFESSADRSTPNFTVFIRCDRFNGSSTRRRSKSPIVAT